MFQRHVTLTVIAAGAIAAALVGAAANVDREARVERVDFREVRTAVSPSFQAELPPASGAPIKEYVIPITHDRIEIADGVFYDGWTFGGTVPGPTIRVREGDLVRVTLINESPMGHSIDFHSARIAPNLAYRTIVGGEELTFEFVAKDPGVYVVHCGTPPITLHIMQGMYLTMIVDPRRGWGSEVDREFVLTQSEFYTFMQDGAALPDYKAAMDKRASWVTFNGRAFQYKNNPLQVERGERVRFFVANAGPSFRSDFHVVGAVFDRVHAGGDPKHALSHVQTWTVPAGGGAVFETTFGSDPADEGYYPFVTHAFADAEKGAVGLVRVGAPKGPTMAH